MGPGIAAGPHCPFASGSAEAGLSQWAVSRDGNQNRVLVSLPPGSILGRSLVRFPRGLPAQGRSPGGSPLGGFGTRVPLPCLPRHQGPKPVISLRAGSSAEALVPPGMVISRSPGAMPGSQLPGRNPVLPDPSGTEIPSEPVAVRRPEGTAFCRAGPGSEDPVSRLFRSAGPKAVGPEPVPILPKEHRSRMGAVRSLPPPHPLKGKPVLVRIAAASSAALPSASTGHQSEDGTRHPPGLWLGRLSPVAGRSSRPHPEAVTESESVQAHSTCG